MLGRRLTLLMVTALALGVTAGCSKKQPPATDDRGRVEPPPPPNRRPMPMRTLPVEPKRRHGSRARLRTARSRT